MSEEEKKQEDKPKDKPEYDLQVIFGTFFVAASSAITNATWRTTIATLSPALSYGAARFSKWGFRQIANYIKYLRVLRAILKVIKEIKHELRTLVLPRDRKRRDYLLKQLEEYEEALRKHRIDSAKIE